MNVAFRVDASHQIGTGHLMRCLTLGDTLRSRGARTRYVCRNAPTSLTKMVEDGGHELVLLSQRTDSVAGDLAHSHWLGTSQAQDAAHTSRALSDHLWEWVIVDHYAIDARWESAMRRTASKVMVIDDLADRRHDCDLLLDQNLGPELESRYAGKVPGACQMLLGPRYALLREEFWRIREEANPRTGAVKRVLIFFGGVDADNYTARGIEALAGLHELPLHVDVIIGTQHPYRTDVEASCVVNGYQCHVQTTKMAELMATADLAIGAGGSATWERCCVGLPALTLTVAENQRPLISYAASRGLVYAPEIDSNSVEGIRRHLQGIIENPGLRNAISTNAAQMVDGRGARRVARTLGCFGVVLRSATPLDSPQLFAWRNHPSIRAVSRRNEPIDWDTHEHWLETVLADPTKALLVGTCNAEPVGVLRFDISGSDAEVSIYRVPDRDPSASGSDLLGSGERWLAENRPGVQVVRAHVIGDNEPSHRLFSASGYQRESTWYSKRIDA